MRQKQDADAVLGRAEWLKRPETQRIFALLDGQADRTRAVGGVVRDALLDVPRDSPEIDLATELMPAEVMARAQRAGLGVHPTGLDHGTVTIVIGTLVAEITTLREDVATDGRHAVVQFGTDWLRDAQRRDFTLNALYANMQGRLFDPLGGLGDCLANRVRFVGSPTQRIEEDRLRVYRFFRFSASHGKEQLDPEGLAACRAAVGDLGQLSAERVGGEMRRMLQLKRVGTVLRVMGEIGMLPFGADLVELLYRYERRARRPDLPGRMALLLSGADGRELQAKWRLSNDDLKTGEATLTAARLLIDFRLNEAAYRYPAVIADAVDVAAVLADWGDAGRLAVTDELQSLQIPKFPVSGGDLLARGMRQGKALGEELERLEKIWIESGFALDHGALLARARTQS